MSKSASNRRKHDEAVPAGPGGFVVGHRAVYWPADGPLVTGDITHVTASGNAVTFKINQALSLIAGLPHRTVFTYRRALGGWYERGTRPRKGERGLFILKPGTMR